ncbi:hypothetical protein AIOL_004559 [Candidatus Rhodobacter oscarellae]|uniref:Uncharacterized protein n=1 Tax=Candidatus Rhodobacter oscarellae TaxID=1675527 RepID=A0A0J9E9V2_9RHOB|nr:hypothetical protein AIOL_004559 [Candidatus Rhodobacter lobularis]
MAQMVELRGPFPGDFPTAALGSATMILLFLAVTRGIRA